MIFRRKLDRGRGIFASPAVPPLRIDPNTMQGIASMQPNMIIRALGPTVYVDANPLSEKHLTGIGRYTARICLALAARGARVRFFSDDREVIPAPGLDWSADQDLGRWARGSGKAVGSSLWKEFPTTPSGFGASCAPPSEPSP